MADLDRRLEAPPHRGPRDRIQRARRRVAGFVQVQVQGQTALLRQTEKPVEQA